ncbi:formylglycine-generating enzyme family protein [Pseudomonas auratipiscis]|uniref:SUMF1/EgtB/PvdO family nonheme iron enzyme n=1 Tax=Pseudomonas auratipiscis TaxID=3115853 RepID=A0AB35WUY7_9PSED|nr:MULTISPECIES: SUMF1/EgtB/PvdO family nonheme iron enzyme [unclassified Pseudomonas]MEE1868433.1 SUMF1/EgtB/PvdO family nonheme iron enzyme [Pseudomonas sp. 120P]MEE1959749.1 SUMF1/EgtB/PvdO family nonheme iron enzyme [Pseudomonas sp. 119P]
MPRQFLLATCTLLLLAGCQGQSIPHPKSQKLSVDKVNEIASTIERKYPNLSAETRGKVLNTVVQSLGNMVFIEGGEFQMGDFGWPRDDDPSNLCDWPCGVEPTQMGPISMGADNKFVHPVKLKSFSLSKYQVTLDDFDIFFIANGKELIDTEYRQRADLQHLYQPKLPAPTKSWQEAKDYCGWLGTLSNYPIDLPTEAQWEYAARNRGQYLSFPTDNGNLNYGRNFPHPDEQNTFPVDRFVPNPLGIYNLSGNATDWVNDWYDEDYYQYSPLEDPQGPAVGVQKSRRGANVGEDPLLTGSTVMRLPSAPIKIWYLPGSSFRCSIQSHSPLSSSSR